MVQALTFLRLFFIIPWVLSAWKLESVWISCCLGTSGWQVFDRKTGRGLRRRAWEGGGEGWEGEEEGEGGGDGEDWEGGRGKLHSFDFLLQFNKSGVSLDSSLPSPYSLFVNNETTLLSCCHAVQLSWSTFLCPLALMNGWDPVEIGVCQKNQLPSNKTSP